MHVVCGRGLHGGGVSRVTLTRAEQPHRAVRVRTAKGECDVDELRLVSAELASTVSDARGDVRLRTVEHLFAALAAFGVRSGLVIDLEGDELPLLDGGAAEWCAALTQMSLPASAPMLRVACDGVIEIGDSVYRFARGDRVHVSVAIDFGDARLSRDASWDGDAGDFRERVAPARTFAMERDLDDIARRGLASHVAPESVVLIAKDQVLSAGAPFTADEPARHKLLDLIGDLYLYGGPPIGEVHATRPGHAATHEAVRRAREGGMFTSSV